MDLTMSPAQPGYRLKRDGLNVVTIYTEELPPKDMLGNTNNNMSYYGTRFAFSNGLQANRFCRILYFTSKIDIDPPLACPKTYHNVKEQTLGMLERYATLYKLSVPKILILLYYPNLVSDLPISYLNYLEGKLNLLNRNTRDLPVLLNSADTKHKFACGAEYAVRTYDLHSTLAGYLTHINPNVYETLPPNTTAIGTYISDLGSTLTDSMAGTMSRVPLYQLEKLATACNTHYLNFARLLKTPLSHELLQLLYSTDMSNIVDLQRLNYKLYRAGYITGGLRKW